MTTRVALVTGSNKGIGLATVRSLCKQFDGDVILTARDELLGRTAIAELNQEGLFPVFHQLDITDTSSIDTARHFLVNTYGGLDVLVNNVGISHSAFPNTPFAEQAEILFRTNFYGTLNVCNALYPILRPYARVVNVSSLGAQIALWRCSEHIRNQLLSPDLDIGSLLELMHQYLTCAKEDRVVAGGWPEYSYGVAKIGTILMTEIHQKQFDTDARTGILVNSCCPGRCRTDMSGGNGPKSPDEGALNPVYLALLPRETTSPRGEYISELKVIPRPWRP